MITREDLPETPDWHGESKPSPFRHGLRRSETTPEQWAAYAAEFQREADEMADAIFETPQHRMFMRGTDVALAEAELDGLGTE